MPDLKDTFVLDDIPIYTNGLGGLTNKIKKLLDKRDGSIQIITLNTDFLRIAEKDTEFKNICKNASIVVPDGIGISLLLRIKYKTIIERITGNDMLDLLLRISDEQKLRIAFLGSGELTLSKLGGKIQRDYPDLEITNLLSPPQNFENNSIISSQLVQQLKENNPDILFVALGCPRQEKWIYNNKDEVGFKIGIGVGAALDFYTGTKKRSPVFLQTLGLEWTWRLITEPKRLFKRYIFQDLPYFIRKSIKIKFH